MKNAIQKYISLILGVCAVLGIAIAYGVDKAKNQISYDEYKNISDKLIEMRESQVYIKTTLQNHIEDENEWRKGMKAEMPALKSDIKEIMIQQNKELLQEIKKK